MAQIFSRRHLIFSSGYNLLGKLIPLLVAVLTTPIIIKYMGVERFGILALIWTFVGYFNVFDLGVGRATTKFTAEYLALNLTEELPKLIWTSWWLLFILGLIGGLAAFIVTPFLTDKILNISPTIIDEARQAFFIMCFSIPIVFLTTGIIGVLQAQQRFALINAVSIPAGIAKFLAPLPVFIFTNNLVPIIIITLLLRLITCGIFFYFSKQSIPGLYNIFLPRKNYIKKLVHFGGWLTVTNIIGPIMVNLDRFFIGSFLSLAAVAYYVTPFDMLSRLNIIVGSITPVLFSAFSSAAALDRAKMNKLFIQSFGYLFLLMMFIVSLLMALANPLLHLWLGSEFAENSTIILQILAVGFMVNSLAHIPYSAIQATGRPDITAKLHLAELPVYLIVVVIFIKMWGLPGIAAAWTLRVTLDAILLFWFANHLRILPEELKQNNLKIILYWSLALLIYLMAMIHLENIILQSTAFILYTFILITSGWGQILAEEDKNFIKEKLSKFSQTVV